MSSLKIKKSHPKIECPCKNCQDIKHLGYYYPDYVIELTQKILLKIHIYHETQSNIKITN